MYIHINKINQKVYIGQTRERNINKRWGNNGIGYKSQARFWRAIQKYGWDNFEHFVVTDWITKKKADEIEIALINLFNSTNKEYGYNISQGGNGPLGVPCSDEKKELLSNMFSGEGNPFYGHKHTEDVKKLLKEKHSIPVVQLDKNGVFIAEYQCATDAGISTNIDIGSILRCCAAEEHYQSAGGYLWMYKVDYVKCKTKQYNNNHLRQVVQLDIQGNFIAEYSSIQKASIATGIHSTGILMCCNDVYKISGGFLWKYKEDYNPNEKLVYIDTKLRPVIQFDIYGNILHQYKSLKEAEMNTGIFSNNISRCCSHKAEIAGGFVWRYADEEYNLDEIKNKKYRAKPQNGNVIQYDVFMNRLAEYNSAVEASNATGISVSSIKRCCREEQASAGGFIWKRMNSNREGLNEI